MFLYARQHAGKLLHAQSGGHCHKSQYSASEFATVAASCKRPAMQRKGVHYKVLKNCYVQQAYQNVHSPYVSPPDWECHAYPQMWDETFANMLHMLDDGIRNVTTAMKSTGMWENALVIFSAE